MLYQPFNDQSLTSKNKRTKVVYIKNGEMPRKDPQEYDFFGRPKYDHFVYVEEDKKKKPSILNIIFLGFLFSNLFSFKKRR